MFSKFGIKARLAALGVFALLFSSAFQANRGIPWWVYLLIILVLIIIIAWALASNRQKGPSDTHQMSSQSMDTRNTSAAAPPARAEVFTAETPAPPPPEAVVTDDLTILEGIGPKISVILQASGIHTYSQLAMTDVEELRRILADNSLQFTDPSSWAEQARLAAAGDQAGLQTLQNRLKGGRQE